MIVGRSRRKWSDCGTWKGKDVFVYLAFAFHRSWDFTGVGTRHWQHRSGLPFGMNAEQLRNKCWWTWSLMGNSNRSWFPVAVTRESAVTSSREYVDEFRSCWINVRRRQAYTTCTARFYPAKRWQKWEENLALFASVKVRSKFLIWGAIYQVYTLFYQVFVPLKLRFGKRRKCQLSINSVTT